MLSLEDTAIIIGLAIIMYALVSGAEKILKQEKERRRCNAVLTNNALRLVRWKNARPFIHTGYCGFARALIFQMINATNDLLSYKPECPELQELRSSLYLKLRDFPPSKDPLPVGPLFVFRPDYARIVGLQTFVSKVRKKMLVSGRLYRGCTYGSPAALGRNISASFYIFPRLRV